MDKEKEKLHRWWIETIQNEGRYITKYEEDFVQSMEDWLDEGRNLTERQAEILEKIYVEKTPN